MKKSHQNLKLGNNIIHKEMTSKAIQASFYANREYVLAKDQYTATSYDNYMAVALSVRDRIVERWIKTQQRYHKQNAKRVYYLSMEFLIGRLLDNHIFNLGLEKEVAKAFDTIGIDFDNLRDQERDAGLGNGGLGRLAACFLDSMATLGIPAHGYGIRYDYGIFHQKIKNGYQIELPDEWLRLGNPWEFARPEYTVKIQFYGHTENGVDEQGQTYMRWIDTQDVEAIPYDMPVPGYKNDVINTLRLWSARSTEEFDLEYFNQGDYEQAVYQKIFSENISKVLYPNDSQAVGRELRLKQEYFFTAAAISDIIRRFKSENDDLTRLHEKAVIQLNDTHPSLAVVELMRVLIDDYRMEWNIAWDVTTKTFAYTNHTLMPEALECWSVPLMERVLPRHLQIIYEINARFLKEVATRFPGDNDRLGRVSLIEEGDTKRVRMANVAVVGSSSVNGVSQLHSELLKTHLFKDLYEFYPEKFNNKTNGITQRRWLLKSNTPLADLITESIGPKWITDLQQLKGLTAFAEKSEFRARWREIKLENKKVLAEYVHKTMGRTIDPTFMFDVQVKRIHEYKRQILFCFYIIAQYLKIKHDPHCFTQPRTFIIGGKAAPGYFMAKLIIKFVNAVADVIDRDEDSREKIQLVFLPNYRVSLAEKIFPASDLSEQISTAGTEASGTGNMKFMLNGALTIGTLDGANVEIAQSLNHENIFIFGLTVKEVASLKARGYCPDQYIERSLVLKEIFALIKNNFFSRDEHGIFDPIVESLYHDDPFLVCADFDAYCRMQDEVDTAYQDQEQWSKQSIINVASSGQFSSDRTIFEYARDIWGMTGEK